MSGIYVHIPFCVKRCNYCDFYSVKYDKEIKNIFIKSLLKEIACTDYRLPVESIYFGGGTPSLLSDREMALILKAIEDNFPMGSKVEITVEANPVTFDINKLKSYRLTGINRLSLGVQSLNDRELKLLGRIHSSEDAIKALRDISKVYDNFSVDILYGIPLQDKDSLTHTLEIVLSFTPPHISAYELTYHEHTPLYERLIKKDVSSLSDEEISELYFHTCEFLTEKGYNHYEISNFSSNGYHCIHNLNYWLRGEYIGFGPSAHSLVGNKRFYNIADLKSYIEHIESSGSAVEHTINLSEKDILEEEIMLGLRTSEGIERTGHIFGEDTIRDLESEGMIKNDAERIILTQKGMSVSNAIIVKLLREMEKLQYNTSAYTKISTPLMEG